MAVLTVGVVAVVVTAGAAAPAIGAAASAGTAAGVATTCAGTVAAGGATATVAGSAGIGAVAGSVAGAVTGGTAAAAGTGAAVGASAAAAASSSSVGAAAITTGIAAGPVGWLILGAAGNNEGGTSSSSSVCTFDCWKSLLHDESREPSNGRLLKDVMGDARIRRVSVKNDSNDDSSLPEIILENIWEEQFLIQYLTLPSSSQMVAHAIRLN